MKNENKSSDLICAAIIGGITGSVTVFILQKIFFAYVYPKPDVFGNLADWVSGIGTIAAIVASIFIMRYQLKNDRRLTRQSFFIEQEFLMIREVSNAIVNVNTTFKYIKNVNTKFKDTQNSKELIQTYIKQQIDYIDIEKNLTFISNNFSEYGEVKTEYYDLTFNYVKPLLEEYKNFKKNAMSLNSNNQIIADNVDNVLSNIFELDNEVIGIKNKIKKSE